MSTERRSEPQHRPGQGEAAAGETGWETEDPPTCSPGGPPGPEPVQGGPLPTGKRTAGSGARTCRSFLPGAEGGREQQPWRQRPGANGSPAISGDMAAARPALLVSAELLTQLQTEQKSNDRARGPVPEPPLRASECAVRADWVSECVSPLYA